MNPNRPRASELTDALLAMRRVFTGVGVFSFAINLLLLTPSLYMLQTYDRVLTSGSGSTLLALTLILVGLLALEGALEFTRSRVLSRVSSALDMQIDGRVFNAMFANAVRTRGESAQALADLGHIRSFLNGRGLLAFFDAPWLPVYLFVVFLLSPWLGLFAAGAAILLIALAWYNERVTGTLHTLSSTLSGQSRRQAGAALRNAEVIEAMGMLGQMRERWMRSQAEFLAALGESNEHSARVGGIVRFFRTVLQSGILGVGAWLVLEQKLTPGGMIAASILLGRALAPVDLAISSWRNVVTAREAFKRLNKLLQEHPEHQQSIVLPRPQGKVGVENLYVAPADGAPAMLKGLSFQIAAGKTVAVIGPSASGKSTLARALVGVRRPVSGTIRLDDADMASWDRQRLGPCLGYLPQDVELFDGTVAENIARFGELDSDRVIDAARQAGVHELILHLPQGYETRIGEGGMNLSGGQRQRIALARALFGDPVLVVLDEPNASLDEAGDAALIAALRKMKEKRQTVFVITHRPNLLAETDAVMLLADGRIKGFSPSAEYLARQRQPAAEQAGNGQIRTLETQA